MGVGALNVGIVGCGGIGHKRARGLGSDHKLVAAADLRIELARSLASEHSSCNYFDDWRKVIDHSETEVIIVATTNDKLVEVAMAAVAQNKPVLVEKPAARNLRELESLLEIAERNKVPVKVGFNHRFHPSFIKAREIWNTGDLGDLMYIRGRYGHGGRLGYEKEWRADPEIAGGGEVLDQGVHQNDLARWFAGDLSPVWGHLATCFWQMPVEDNAFVTLKTPRQQIAWLHVSCTEWKNLFSFEIFAQNGKLQIDGLGGSYGTEGLTFFRMLPEMGPPETSTWTYPAADDSWTREFSYFADCIRDGREPEGNLSDAREVLKIIEAIYALGPTK